MSNLHHLEAVVFDFDGVLNRNYDSTGFFWSRDLPRDHGIDVAAFARAMFDDSFADVLTGKADLRERTAAVLNTLGCATPAHRFLDYWFTKDLTPCHGALGIVGELRARGLRCVIGTNNERHRAGFIWENLLKHHTDGMYAAGPMGVAKPDTAFFAAIQKDLGCADPGRLLMVDDIPANIAGARAAGWQAIQYGDYTTRKLGDPDELRAALGL